MRSAKLRAALATGTAAISLLSFVTLSVGSAGGAGVVNWAKVQTLSKSGPTSMSALIAAAKKEGKQAQRHRLAAELGKLRGAD